MSTDEKRRLSPEAETNLRYAWAVLVLGYNQHDVAAIFGVNAGRVSEAVQAVRLAVTNPTKKEVE